MPPTLTVYMTRIFFSSRRRHTSFSRDWSSDVCSSDLNCCTPFGVQQLLFRNNIAVDGAHVVIVGRSNIVGKPLALILMQKAAGANATVTICHRSAERRVG